MKRILPFLFFCGLISTFTAHAFAVTYTNKQIPKETTVDATVGRFYLSIQGYQSPNASILLTTKSGQFLSSTTADAKGYFTISQILINDGMTGFCLQAVDFKRIGESEACIDITSPITADLDYKDIFLPPTIGLSKKLINAGQDATIYGYSMPNAIVKLIIEGKIITLHTDSSGYYEYIYKNVPAGIYRIFATGELNGKTSLPPTKSAVLESLSITSQLTQTGQKVTKEAQKKIPFDFLLFLLIGLLFLALIGFLLYKLKFRLWVTIIDFLRHRKKMHHDWFLDFWD